MEQAWLLTWGSRALAVARVLVLAFVGYATLIFFVQRFLAFPGTFRDPPRATPSAPLDGTQVWLETSFGRVEAWYYDAGARALGPTIVFAHGNGELIDDWDVAMRRLTDAGLHALAVEYPGYGHSDGRPSRATLRETFGQAFDWLAVRVGIDATKIVAFGRSMGGGAAGDLSRDRPVAALVLASTFSSAAAIARQSFVPGFLVRDRFDNRSAIADFTGPVLLMHGPGDDVIPYSHAETLARARTGLEIVQLDCAHNDCDGVWPTIVLTLTTFLERSGLTR